MKRTITTSLICSLICLFIVTTINAQYFIGTSGITNNNKTITNNTNSHTQYSPSSNGLTQLYSATGHYFLSADGAGKNSTSGINTFNIRVNKPTAAATVYKAYLMSTSTANPIPAGCVTLAGNTIVWDNSVTAPLLPGSYLFYNYEADVTSIVAPLINPLGAGISTLEIGECFITNPAQCCEALDGEALLVIFSDVTATEKTIIIMWGACNVNGDSYSIVLGAPIDPVAPGSLLDMGLGIGYSAPPGQYSKIDVNSARLTTSASGYDDGVGANGGLITVGGIGDTDGNPADPNALPVNSASDDELYSLLPFITNTTTNITVATQNPSTDDNIFLSYFELSGSAIILNGSGIVLAQSTSSGCIPATHTVTATVVDAQSVPVEGVTVNFSVTTGPNAGVTGNAVTDVNGQATFTYAGSGGVGTDQIQACFLPQPPPGPNLPSICSNILNFDWANCTQCIPTLSEWGLIILALLLMAAGLVYIRKRQYSFASAGNEDVTNEPKSLFNRRSYFIILAILLGIALVAFAVETVFSMDTPLRDIFGTLVSCGILAFIIQLFVSFRKE